MNNSASKLSVLFISVDFSLLNISFFTLNYLRKGTLRLPDDYSKLLLFFYAISLLVSLLTNKFRPATYCSYFKGLIALTRSMIFIIYGISLLAVLTFLSKFSRIHIFGTCAIWFILEIALFSIYYESFGKDIVKKIGKLNLKSYLNQKITYIIFFSDFLLLLLTFFLLNLYKRDTLALSLHYEKVLLIIIGLWFVFSLITRKFDVYNFHNFFYAMAACIKAAILMILFVSVVIYSFRLFGYSRFHIYGTFVMLVIFEALLYFLYFRLKFERKFGRLDEFVVERKHLEQQKLPIINNNKKTLNDSSFMKIFSERYLRSYPGLFDFVSKSLNISDFDASEIAIMNSPDRVHLKILPTNSLSLMINLQRVNDIRWMNQYFLEVYKHLINGGYFIGRGVTIDVHKKNFFKKYPEFFSNIFYIFHFIFFRMFPKLPYLKKIYFAFTKGKGRIISWAELLGRLYFCGFDVLAEKEINGSLFFIAFKAKTPSKDPSPTYGPLVKLKRIGLNGQLIEVYKFRTMYPYSEYLQDYIYKMQKLQSGGKIKDDFRVTEYGRFIRKYWLDELPMLYNWIRGELKLFGVRPLSKHYLNLYDRSLRRMRQKVKPGLVPPYYADLPKKIEEIKESERRYIQSYYKHPLRTQWTYFWRAMNNIIFKGARSS